MPAEPPRYPTIAGPGLAEVTEKKSRFLGRALMANHEADAQRQLTELKNLEPDATHHAWAFSIGSGTPLLRFCDAGEPSGTAGRPLLHLLEMRGLRNVLLVVSRWYGGTKLGSGGLARAYAAAGAAALESAGTTEMLRGVCLRVRVDYPDAARVERRLKERGVRLDPTSWQEQVLFQGWFAGKTEDLVRELADLSAGRARLEIGSAEYRPLISAG